MSFKYCPNCGKKLPKGNNNFCQYCGYKIMTDSQKNTQHIADTDEEKHKLVKEPHSSDNSNDKNTLTNPTLGDSDAKFTGTLIFVCVVACLMILVWHSTRLPKGLSNYEDVMEYCLKRDKLLNNIQNMEDVNNSIASEYGLPDAFDNKNNDEDTIQLLKNKNTNRYVFRYKYKNKSIPCYVIVVKFTDVGGDDNGYRELYMVPVKKQHIAGIMKDDVSQDYIDDHFNYDKYIGFSYDDMSDENVSLDSGIRLKDVGKDTYVSYDDNN